MREYKINNKSVIMPHNILFATTSDRGYDMSRLLLLEDMPDTSFGEFVLVEGSHCSCYDFDEAFWYAVVYDKFELEKLLVKTSDHDSLRKKLKNFLDSY